MRAVTLGVMLWGACGVSVVQQDAAVIEPVDMAEAIDAERPDMAELADLAPGPPDMYCTAKFSLCCDGTHCAGGYACDESDIGQPACYPCGAKNERCCWYTDMGQCNTGLKCYETPDPTFVRLGQCEP